MLLALPAKILVMIFILVVIAVIIVVAVLTLLHLKNGSDEDDLYEHKESKQ